MRAIKSKICTNIITRYIINNLNVTYDTFNYSKNQRKNINIIQRDSVKKNIEENYSMVLKENKHNVQRAYTSVI